MPELRIERTDFLKLLAIMKATPAEENWGFPYWNQLVLDAVLNALHNAPRDGVALVADPTGTPTLAISTSGVLYAGKTIEVKQSFVDEYGRETAATAASSQATNAAITDPDTAPVISYVSGGATGFDGGPLKAWVTHVDANGGETLPSPADLEDLPFLSASNKNIVTITVAESPTTLGVDHINVYIQHRNGNIVLHDTITGSNVAVQLDSTSVDDCLRSYPDINSTNRTQSLNITGVSAPTNAVYTRFYIKDLEADWTSGSYLFVSGGVSDFDVATVSYPLNYTGAMSEKTDGQPRSSSAVQSIAQIDLTDEVMGILDETFIDAEIARDAELVAMLGGPYVLSGLVTTAQGTPDMTVQVSTGWAISNTRVWNPGADTSVPIATADPTNPRIDIVCINASGAIVSSSEDATCKGTPAGSPSAPATPAGYVLLAQVSVPATDTTIESGQITDARDLGTTIPLIVDHMADVDAHESKLYSATSLNNTCSATSSSTFAITLKDCILTEVNIIVTSGGAIDFDLEFYSDASRTVMVYQAQSITDSDWSDLVPWGYNDVGGTIYGKIVNNSASDITDADVTLTYRR